MKLVKTVKCKLKVDEHQKEAIHDTIAKFTQACNDILALAREKKCWNRYKLHRLCYYQIKERHKLHANYVIRAIAKVSVRRQRRPKFFKAMSLDLDARLFGFNSNSEGESLSLATTKGRLKGLKLSMGNFQRGLLKGQKPTSATLVYKKYKKSKSKKEKAFYINLVLEKEVAVPSPSSGGSDSASAGSNPIGVDRGKGYL